MEDWLCDRRAIYAALLADPGASYCGCWRVQPAALAVDAGLSRQKVEALLPKMEPLVYWCPERRIVFLPTFAEEQTAPKGCKVAGKRDHQRISAENHNGPFSNLASTWAQVGVKLGSSCRQLDDDGDDTDDGDDPDSNSDRPVVARAREGATPSHRPDGPPIAHPAAQATPDSPSIGHPRCCATTSTGKPCTHAALAGRDVCGVHAKVALPPEALEHAAVVLERHWQVLGLAGRPSDQQRRVVARCIVDTGLGRDDLCAVVDYLARAPWNLQPDGTPMARAVAWLYGDADRLQRWVHDARGGAPTVAPVAAGNGGVAPIADPARDAARRVVLYHAEVMGKPAIADDASVQLVVNALGQGFSEEQCRLAVDGCKASTFHMGDNKTGERYNGIRQIFKDGDKTKGHIERAENGAPSKVGFLL